MPRKSVKSASTSASRSSSKRAAPDKATPTRQSKRTKATPAKSPYFEPDSEDDAASPPSDDAESGDYQESTKTVSEAESDLEPSNDEYVKPKKGRGRSAKQETIPLRKKSDDKELWKPGAKLEPGTTVVFKKPKAREAGNTPYQEHTIHPNTFLFLEDLAANNDRQWLKLHDPDYRASWSDFTAFLEKLSEKVIDLDETIPELPVKDIFFRIYRDIRFSKDPTPYKTHFSAAWSRTGRKGPYAAYYVQIQPDGQSFVGGGLWHPEAEFVNKLRHDIDRKPHKIKRVLTDAGIRKSFLGGVANDEKKAVKAFVGQTSNQSTALKKHPKGYGQDHKDIELLRLRNFTLGTKVADEEMLGERGLDHIAGHIANLVPFITYLNSVVMPDEESSGSSEDQDDGDGDGDGDESDNS
ncbi:hypothetical protein EJ04DRAFT_417914, partial [Polyplosphaeria fusca]